MGNSSCRQWVILIVADQTTVNEVQKRKRGRPSKTNPAPANLSYAISLEIKVKDEAVEKLKKALQTVSQL